MTNPAGTIRAMRDIGFLPRKCGSNLSAKRTLHPGRREDGAGTCQASVAALKMPLRSRLYRACDGNGNCCEAFFLGYRFCIHRPPKAPGGLPPGLAGSLCPVHGKSGEPKVRAVSKIQSR